MDVLLSQIEEGIHEVFPETGDMHFTLETQLIEIPGWDSMMSVNLQLCLEEKFDIKIPDGLLNEETQIIDIIDFYKSPDEYDIAV